MQKGIGSTHPITENGPLNVEANKFARVEARLERVFVEHVTFSFWFGPHDKAVRDSFGTLIHKLDRKTSLTVHFSIRDHTILNFFSLQWDPEERNLCCCSWPLFGRH
jgi:hypothetical protein